MLVASIATSMAISSSISTTSAAIMSSRSRLNRLTVGLGMSTTASKPPKHYDTEEEFIRVANTSRLECANDIRRMLKHKFKG